MKPKVIKNEEECDRALARVEELMERAPTSAVNDEMELLATLIEVYEAKTYPTPALDPIDAIRFRMEQMELRQKDLVPYMGSKSKVSEVLAGKRSLSLSMIKKLNTGLGISLETLLEQERDLLLVAEERSDYGAEGKAK